VELEEGPLLVSKLMGNSENAKLGATGKVEFDPVTDGVTLPKFTPA